MSDSESLVDALINAAMDYSEERMPDSLPRRKKRLETMRQAVLDRLATPASAPVGERTDDARRFFWLGMHLAGTKWADALESLRPRDAEGDYTEKYIGGPDSLRNAIDAARAAERRDQEEGR